MDYGLRFCKTYKKKVQFCFREIKHYAFAYARMQPHAKDAVNEKEKDKDKVKVNVNAILWKTFHMWKTL